MNVLVLNCGSSSVKFQLIETNLEAIKADKDVVHAQGVIERIGSQSLITLTSPKSGQNKQALPIRDHSAAVQFILQWLMGPHSKIDVVNSLSDVHAVGHRVVHGGEQFKESVLIDDQVIKGIQDCIELAPLHNPANLAGIFAVKELIGASVPQVAVFDTAFHAQMPPSSFLYAIPYQYYRRYKVRRYGFHGTSHRYIAYRYRKLENLPKDKVKIITLHLGNGCSACAIKEGMSVATTMGMTPLEGLIMGTRSGDIDPAIIEFLMLKEGLNIDQIDTMLNKQSGLLGISGLTNDMRELLAEAHENKDRRAELAIELFCQKVRRYLGAYLAELNGADAIIFGGGIGENSSEIRERICKDLDQLGVVIDAKTNAAFKNGEEGLISHTSSKVKVYVIPTNEELLIARDTVRCID